MDSDEVMHGVVEAVSRIFATGQAEQFAKILAVAFLDELEKRAEEKAENEHQLLMQHLKERGPVQFVGNMDPAGKDPQSCGVHNYNRKTGLCTRCGIAKEI